jgi:hypothetical protein
MIQALMLLTRKKYFCTERNTLRYWLHTRKPQMAVDDFLTSAATSLRMALTGLWDSAGRARLLRVLPVLWCVGSESRSQYQEHPNQDCAKRPGTFLAVAHQNSWELTVENGGLS